MAYNKTNGVMLGIREKGTLSGSSNDTIIFIQYEQHTELEGYNLPNFDFGVDQTPTPTNTTGNPLGENLGLILGLSIGIPVGVALIVTTVILVNKKRKSTVG